MAIEGADEQQGAMTVPELMGYYRISRSCFGVKIVFRPIFVNRNRPSRISA
jgi:hypothetical protein